MLVFDRHVQPDRSEDERRLVEKAQRALVAISLGADAEALDEVAPSAVEPQERSAETRELMLLLFGECSAMVSTLRKCGPGLVDHVDGFLGSLIEGGYRLRICLEGALGHDERRKLGRDVHIGRL